MSGSSTIPFFEIPQGFTLTVPGPIDSRMIISSVSNLTTEIASGVRTEGVLTWVTDEQQYYCFVGGTTNDKFVSLSSLLVSGAVHAISFTYTSLLSANVYFDLAHNLNTINLHVTFYDGTNEILIDYSTNSVNTINIRPNIDIANLRVVITGINTSQTNPTQTPTNSALSVIKHLAKVTNFTQTILNSEKLISIDYRVLTGTPTVICGTSGGGNDIHTSSTISTDSNKTINKTFPLQTVLYFTISGGSVNVSITTQSNIF